MRIIYLLTQLSSTKRVLRFMKKVAQIRKGRLKANILSTEEIAKTYAQSVPASAKLFLLTVDHACRDPLKRFRRHQLPNRGKLYRIWRQADIEQPRTET